MSARFQRRLQAAHSEHAAVTAYPAIPPPYSVQDLPQSPPRSSNNATTAASGASASPRPHADPIPFYRNLRMAFQACRSAIEQAPLALNASDTGLAWLDLLTNQIGILVRGERRLIRAIALLTSSSPAPNAQIRPSSREGSELESLRRVCRAQEERVRAVITGIVGPVARGLVGVEDEYLPGSSVTYDGVLRATLQDAVAVVVNARTGFVEKMQRASAAQRGGQSREGEGVTPRDRVARESEGVRTAVAVGPCPACGGCGVSALLQGCPRCYGADNTSLGGRKMAGAGARPAEVGPAEVAA